MKRKLLLFILILMALAVPSPARADGIIVPVPSICDPCPPPPCVDRFPCPPPTPMSQLVVRQHHVTVTIQDQVAVTHVDQVFYNPNDWAVEGTYMFPLPLDAAVTGFTLWIDGQPVAGQILDAEQARQQYQEIVNRLRDPALLEYSDRGAVQAHIFPIPPQGERRIELEYSQALAAENGLVRYVYPLNTEKFSMWPLEEVSVSLELRASVPIRAVYSPSHPVAVSRDGEYHVTAGYEAKDVLPDTDFTLYYSLGETQAFHLLTYRDPQDSQEADGFFLALLAPQPQAESQALAKDVILVLDHSGSMDGEKFRQAQAAAEYILQHLNPEDRFALIAFSTGVETFSPDLRPAVAAPEAQAWVERLSAQGSTDINRALLEAAALSRGGRPAYVIFLTDGLPTEGVVDSQQILDNLHSAATDNLRLFVFGVGYDVDTFLLDSLAQAHHGTSSYVLPGEALDEKLSAFYAKISSPVLTGLSLDFGGLPVYDLYPNPLPDLFSGSQIILVGRYRQGGATTVTLSGSVDGETRQFEFPDQVFALDQTDQQAIPRLWATRKVGYLLNQVRLNGPEQETIDQIVKLSIRYGIVTPYTSYLVTEPMPLGAAEQDRIANEQFQQLQAAPAAPSSGQAAVERADQEGKLAAADNAPSNVQEANDAVRIVGARTFVLADGKWVDTAFDPEQMQTVKVAFLSADYFALVEAQPDLAAAFALGQAVIAMSAGKAYEVVPSGSNVAPVDLPPTATQDLSTPQATPASNRQPPATPQPQPAAPTGRSSLIPCLGGLLPLVLAGAWWTFTHRRR